MIEKPLMIIIFMYSIGFGIVIVQYLYADVINQRLVINGVDLTSNIITISKINDINTMSTNIKNAPTQTNSSLTAIENAYNIAIKIGLELLMLLTGTYIFNILYLLGIPVIVIVPFVIIYVFMLGRTLIAYLRGI